MSPQDAGEVRFEGAPVETDADRRAIRRRGIGFVFQRFNLLGVLGARDNVAISLKVRGLKPDGRVERLFEAMGIAHVAGRKPGQMSIGEQQRVAVVRAMAHAPALILADEPTGNLDTASSNALLELLSGVNRDSGQTIVMITHSPEAAKHADRVVHMRDGVIREATP